MAVPTRLRFCVLRADQAGFAAWLAAAAWCPPTLGQSTPLPSERKPPQAVRLVSSGVEIAVGSGHADRGFVISDRPVIQPVVWLSRGPAELSLWGNLTMMRTTDSSRPRIVELELTRPYRWRRLTIAPAVRMFFYHDPVRADSDRSMEAWLDLSYDAGPFRLYGKQSLDVLTYQGAYFGEAGIESAGRLSPVLDLGASLGGGWASSRFNDAYAGLARSAFDRISVQGWLTAHVSPHGYLGPHVEFSTIVDPGVRAVLSRPSFLLIGLTTGVEF